MKTAVEWLVNEIPNIDWENSYWKNRFEQAKQIEKQQIMKAVFDSMGTNLDPNIERAELYYNETFKSE